METQKHLKPHTNYYAKHCTRSGGFGSQDTVVYIDRHRFDALQDISYSKTFDSVTGKEDFAGSITFVNSQDDELIKLLGPDAYNPHTLREIYVFSANEAGDMSDMKFSDVQFVANSGGIRVDDMISKVCITFTFKRHQPIQRSNHEKKQAYLGKAVYLKK